MSVPSTKCMKVWMHRERERERVKVRVNSNDCAKLTGLVNFIIQRLSVQHEHISYARI